MRSKAFYALVCLLFSCHQALEPEAVTSTEGKPTRDIAYSQIEGVEPNLLSLDVYAPKAAKPLPVLVFVHGGGWQKGDKSNQMKTKPSFFNELGFVFVSVNYRLSPAIQHPGHVQDVVSSIAWVYQNIASYGGDPNQISLMGHSAGAHLVALVATDESHLQKLGLSLQNLRGVIALDSAGYDIPLQLESSKRERMQSIYQQAFTSDPEVWRAASPYHHIAANKGIPPFLLVHADERRDSELQAKRMANSLNSVGVAATTFRAEGKDHAAVNQDVGSNDAMTKEVVAFLQGL